VYTLNNYWGWTSWSLNSYLGNFLEILSLLLAIEVENHGGGPFCFLLRRQDVSIYKIELLL